MHLQANVPTEHAKRYLGQFVKHFGHKLPTSLADTHESGEVNFSLGICQLKADAAELKLFLNAETEQDMTHLESVVTRHLVRFAFREDLALDWKAA